MPKTLTVAVREFKATAMTKAFFIAAVVVPVLMIGLAAIGPMLFNPQPPPLKGTIAIIDPDGGLARAAEIEFAPDKIRERIHQTAKARQESPSGLAESGSISEEMGRNSRNATAVMREFEINLTLDDKHTSSEFASLKSKLAAGGLVAIISTAEVPTTQSTQPKNAASANTTRLYVPSGMNIKHTGLIEDLVQASTARARIQAAGLDVQTVRDLARAPEPATIRVSEKGEERAENTGAKVFKMMVPMAFMMLIWMGAFISANYLLTTTIEEKSNKVMEVLLSAVSPLQLMAGKILGQAAVGLVMITMYLSMGIVALLAAAYFDLINWSQLVYFGLYYVMAYFMIASIMAAIGSAVNDLREAQSLVTPAMVMLMIPLMLWLPISDSPNGMLATVTSFIPPLIPFVMILRTTGSEPIATWQIVASMVVGYASMFGMIWMAAKIFRVGVLMTGKPPTPLELIKWVRYK